MSIFSKKSKGEKGAEKKDKKGKKGKEQPGLEVRQAQPQYQDVPSPTTQPRPGHRRQSSREASGQGLGNGPQIQDVNPNHSSALSPSYGHQTRNAQAIPYSNSTEVYMTDPNAPPMPTSPSAQQTKGLSPRGIPRNHSGYFAPSSSQSQPGEGPAFGNPKMAFAARDRGYINAHHSADSGYGSTAHSRAPSEQVQLEGAGPQLSRSNSELLPKLSLSEELAREPAFSDNSFDGDELNGLLPRRAPDGVLKTRKPSSSAIDANADARALRASRFGKKQTRFEHVPIAVSTKHPEVGASGPMQDDSRPESATLPPQQHQVDLGKQHVPQTFTASQQQIPASAKASSPPPAGERVQDYTNLSSPYIAPATLSTSTPLERIVSNQSVSNLPPIRILDGFKVNKRGKILDEEGDVIGELCEGDIIDCVRQKVNGFGEVMDDYGTVVGRVRVFQRTLESPIARTSATQPSSQPLGQHSQYQPPHLAHTPSTAIDYQHTRQASNASRTEAFTPAWQQQGHIGHSMFAEELRSHLASAPQEDTKQPTQPLDFPGNVTAVELDAGSTAQEEEALPIFDYSEVFMPTPFVPTRSAQQDTPSSFLEHGHSRSVSQQVQTAPILQSNFSRQDMQKQSRHTSAPPAPRQYTFENLQAAPQPAEQIEAPQSPSNLSNPGARPDTERQEPLPAVSESTGHEPFKSFTRPTISPVPEDTHTIPEQAEEPVSLFSYKGEIPAHDGPDANARLAASRQNGGLSPPTAFRRQVSSGAMNSAQYSSAGPFGPPGKPPRQFTTGVPGMKPTFQSRSSYNAPLKKSPLSSHETTPPDSDNGSWDGDAYANGMYSRQPSLRSVNTARTTTTMTTMNTAKPRTYFTHNGRVVSNSGPAPAEEAAVAAAANTAESVPAAASIGGKKSRFSFRLNKK